MNKNPVKPLKANILVVDDQPDNLRVLATILAQHGYHVRKALNGEMALLACQAARPDVILLDINMPDMNGYEVCECLKAKPETSNIPVIFISVLDNVLDKVKAFNIGGVDYITKPFEFEEVVARIQNQLTIQRLQIQLQEKNRKLREQNALLLQEIHKRQLTEAALQEANQKLQRLAAIDSLTEIANRRYFDEYLQREWQRSLREQLPLTLMLCDIDFFKLYNDTYGHQAGDVCLKQVAQSINNALKRPGDLVARYGGEEFAVILPNTSFYGAVQVAQKIQTQVQQLKIVHATSSVNKYITLSIGISSIVPTSESSPETLIAATDKALYQAKEAGRNHFCAYIMLSQSESPNQSLQQGILQFRKNQHKLEE